VYDLSKPGKGDVVEGATYFSGDILNEKQLLDCLTRVRFPYVSTPDTLIFRLSLSQTSVTTVFHTVSPVHGLKETIYYRVNIEGTRTILSACQAARVKAFIFTSSSSVVWSDKDVGGLTEAEAKIPDRIYEAYNHTKGIAEKMVGSHFCYHQPSNSLYCRH
jgi:sterol-4alpha-carboxylate 3-dehydrogenase (decarboxylating)